MIEGQEKIQGTEVEVGTKAKKILEGIHQKDQDMILQMYPEVESLHTEEILQEKSLLEENQEVTLSIHPVKIAPNIIPVSQEGANQDQNQETEIRRKIGMKSTRSQR